jgi:hypothetical protein
MRDLKNSFYRTLHLDKESQEVLKWYRKIVKSLQNEPESNKINIKDSKQIS